MTQEVVGDFFVVVVFIAAFFSTCVYVQNSFKHMDFSLVVNLTLFRGGKRIVCKRFSMWLV